MRAIAAPAALRPVAVTVPLLSSKNAHQCIIDVTASRARASSASRAARWSTLMYAWSIAFHSSVPPRPPKLAPLKNSLHARMCRAGWDIVLSAHSANPVCARFSAASSRTATPACACGTPPTPVACMRSRCARSLNDSGVSSDGGDGSSCARSRILTSLALTLRNRTFMPLEFGCCDDIPGEAAPASAVGGATGRTAIARFVRFGLRSPAPRSSARMSGGRADGRVAIGGSAGAACGGGGGASGAAE